MTKLLKYRMRKLSVETMDPFFFLISTAFFALLIWSYIDENPPCILILFILVCVLFTLLLFLFNNEISCCFFTTSLDFL
jgi:hypothetical protein